ncbi:molecular chaperone TorD family protein [Breoghania sp. L-A4]|uniref:TorD/DmsD family molecular chaperone n=1 Tax=Breoghania sp. L-A4 TaxID=2304600 RepID=UPI0020C04023|nr:molecular chaperone TorD family protein [Breoghania sp. L-A4]
MAEPASDRRATEEDVTRAQIYGLLAGLLAAPADASTLKSLAQLPGDESQLGQALGALSRVAAGARDTDVAREYHDLFIGVGRGELLPYASYYLTGFLNEKPLAKLRGRMAELGIERDPSVKEPEDHVAAVMDMMAG